MKQLASVAITALTTHEAVACVVPKQLRVMEISTLTLLVALTASALFPIFAMTSHLEKGMPPPSKQTTIQCTRRSQPNNPMHL